MIKVAAILDVYYRKLVCLFCFDLGFQISNPVIEYQPITSCMSYMEAYAEMP